MRLQPTARWGFTLVEIMIVVAIIGLLVAIAVPNFLKQRQFAQTQACIKNLATIEAAKQMWGVENRKAPGSVPLEADLVGVTLYIKIMPQCPAGGTYEFRSIGENVTCTIANHALP